MTSAAVTRRWPTSSDEPLLHQPLSRPGAGPAYRELASPRQAERYRAASLRVGDALTRIRIPKLGVDVVVVQGTSPSALRAGAGHYPDTPLPCDVGNVGIPGHRTTYGKPFANLDRLTTGDAVILETPTGRCPYEVSREPFVTVPSDLSVVANTPQRVPNGALAVRLVRPLPGATIGRLTQPPTRKESCPGP